MSKVKSDKYQKKRESAETSRVGMKWDHDEDERLLSAAKEKTPLHEIARSHCREVGGIATRLYHHAVKMMDENGIDKVSEILNISVEEIQKHIATKEKRREYIQNIQNKKSDEKEENDQTKEDLTSDKNDKNDKNVISLLTEIRDLLAVIAKK